MILRHTAIAALMLGFAGCESEPEEEKKPEPRGRVEIVGRIASVPPGRDFVLIQSFGDWKVRDGAILTTRGAGERSASLLVTGEKLGQFAAADIRAGEVAVGDAVLRLPAASPPPRTEPAPQPQEESEVKPGENEQDVTEDLQNAG